VSFLRAFFLLAALAPFLAAMAAIFSMLAARPDIPGKLYRIADLAEAFSAMRFSRGERRSGGPCCAERDRF
jgi:uncharacterized BrkB/YihY/UPF0761 family membrane protein